MSTTALTCAATRSKRGALEKKPPRTTDAIAAEAAAAAAVAAPPPTGDGSHGAPFRAPPRPVPNASGCLHCPTPRCGCREILEHLRETYSAIGTKRRTEGATRGMCAKSLLPPFVARLIDELHIGPEDTFVDLGCGNGSVLLQVAWATGARCIGVELCPHNALVAQQALRYMQQRLHDDDGRWGFESEDPTQNGGGGTNAHHSYGTRSAAVTRTHDSHETVDPHDTRRRLPLRVEIHVGDLADFIMRPEFVMSAHKILCSNLLFPKSLTQFIAERCRALPVGAGVVCFDDFYPHGRSVARVRDPQAFELFRMVDYEWPRDSVEWCTQEGRFYIHWRI